MRLLSLAFLAGAFGALAGQQTIPPQTPFRGGVELVLVDATVLDKSGLPIPDLQPGDFTLKVEGKKRTVVAARYFASDPRNLALATRGTNPGLPPSPIFASQPIATDERAIMVVVDQDKLRFGEAYNSMSNLADYLDALPPTDKVGLVLLPLGSRIDPTDARALTRTTLTKTTGTSGRWRECFPTFGEAAAHSAGDSRGQRAYQGRLASLGCGTGPNIDLAIERYRRETRALLESLASVAAGLADQPRRRAIILVSEGIFVDDDTRRDFSAFAATLERHRVVLYAIHLDFPFVDAASRMNLSLTRQVDDRYGFDGMAETTFVAGGEAVRAISRVTPAIARIDRAMLGSYVVAFEREPGDPAGKRLGLKIEVSRQGTDVRTRSHVIIRQSP